MHGLDEVGAHKQATQSLPLSSIIPPPSVPVIMCQSVRLTSAWAVHGPRHTIIKLPVWWEIGWADHEASKACRGRNYDNKKSTYWLISWQLKRQRHSLCWIFCQRWSLNQQHIVPKTCCLIVSKGPDLLLDDRLDCNSCVHTGTKVLLSITTTYGRRPPAGAVSTRFFDISWTLVWICLCRCYLETGCHCSSQQADDVTPSLQLCSTRDGSWKDFLQQLLCSH